MTNMCPYSIYSVCEFFLILARLNFNFSFFRKNGFLSLYLIFSTFEALADFQISNFFLGKVLLHTYLMVDFNFFRQECPSISFFFARLGFFLNILLVGIPR